MKRSNKIKCIAILFGIILLLVGVIYVWGNDIKWYYNSRIVFQYSFIPKLKKYSDWSGGEYSYNIYNKKMVGKNYVSSFKDEAGSKEAYYLLNEADDVYLMVINLNLPDDSIFSVLNFNCLDLSDCTIDQWNKIYDLPIKYFSIDGGNLQKFDKEFSKRLLRSIYFQNFPQGDYTFLTSQPLDMITIINDNELIDLTSLPPIKFSITISNCPNLKSLTGIEKQTEIHSISIRNCPNVDDYSILENMENIKTICLKNEE